MRQPNPARPGELTELELCSSGNGSHCSMGGSELQAALRLRPRLWRRAASRWAPLLEHGLPTSPLKFCKLTCGCCAGGAPECQAFTSEKTAEQCPLSLLLLKLAVQRRFFAFLHLLHATMTHQPDIGR